MESSIARFRWALRLTLVAASASLAVAGPWAPPAVAADLSVSNEAEFRAALSTATSTSGPHVIRIDADFAITDPLSLGDPYYSSDSSLTIEGQGHTVSGDADAETMFLAGGSYSIDISIAHLTLDGFSDYGAIGFGSAFGLVTIEDSTFSNNHTVWDGAALSIYGADLVITGSHFDHNTSDYGGAVSSNGHTEITDSTFAHNAAQGPGAAVYVAGTLDVARSTFSDNTANFDGTDGDGGAVWAEELLTVDSSTFLRNAALSGPALSSPAPIVVTGTDFTDNVATNDGGAIVTPSTVQVSGSTFSGNHAGGSGGAVWATNRVSVDASTFTANTAVDHGGAVFSDDDEVIVVRSSFARNSAGGDGGAVWSYYPITVTSSTFVENAAARGGAIHDEDDDVTVAGSTFAGNTATDGGAIWAYYAVAVNNSTFTGNVAEGSGGAIYARSDDASATHVTFDENSAATGSHVFVGGSNSFSTSASVFSAPAGLGTGCAFASGSATSSGANFDHDATCTAGRSGVGDFGGADPLLDSLANNGGPTLTMAPSPLSPLVSAIPLAQCDVGTLDQTGTSRPLGSGCEPGAVEVLGEITFVIETDAGDIVATVRGALGVSDISNATSSAASTPPPAGLSLPYGVSTFTLDVPSPGATVVVELEFPGPVSELWKLTGGLWSLIASASIDGSTVTYYLIDGGPLDDDGLANAITVDPVAGGFSASFTG